jgi:hypothetical protein
MLVDDVFPFPYSLLFICFTSGGSPDGEGPVGLQHDHQAGVVLEHVGGHGQALVGNIIQHNFSNIKKTFI